MNRRGFIGAASSALALGAAGRLNLASADEAHAKALFKAMTDYMAAQKAIAIDYDSNLEIVSRDQYGSRVAVASDRDPFVGAFHIGDVLRQPVAGLAP